MTPQQPNGPPQHIQIEMARRELRALKQQQAIAEQGIAALSGVAAELTISGDNDAAILRDAARELETGIVRSLNGEPSDRAADLRRIAGRLEVALASSANDSRAILAALVALVSIKLTELQTLQSNLMERIPELENALRVADSGIALPGGMRIKN